MYYKSAVHSPPLSDISIEVRQSDRSMGGILYETSAETIAIAVAAAVARVFRSFMAAPLLGISIGLFVTRIVVKLIDRYNVELSINISKQICYYFNNGSQLRVISLLFVAALSSISMTHGFILGMGLGALNAIVLDIENCKLLQTGFTKIAKE